MQSPKAMRPSSDKQLISFLNVHSLAMLWAMSPVSSLVGQSPLFYRPLCYFRVLSLSFFVGSVCLGARELALPNFLSTDRTDPGVLSANPRAGWLATRAASISGAFCHCCCSICLLRQSHTAGDRAANTGHCHPVSAEYASDAAGLP